MTGTEMKSVVLCLLVAVVVLFVLYQINPMMFRLMSYEGFEEDAAAKAAKEAKDKADKDAKDKAEKEKAAAAAKKPAGFVDKAAFEDMEDN